MSHFSTLSRGIRQIQLEACLLNTPEDFSAFEMRWVAPWRRIKDVYENWPTLIQGTMIHRLRLVKRFQREALIQVKYQRATLEILNS